ncbi:MAG: aminoacyl-histidine dipeptidase [Oscillibacter sp.]|nr:aminoacyl-histidine dipeptidase [Oscillibacter sp.]
MPVLDSLEPRPVFRLFEELCSIPHGSRHTKAISDWCAAFARARGLEVRQDEANNVIIKAPASPGCERADMLILQGHLDMVCEKEAGCPLDMDRQGLDLAIEDGYVKAKGTTLGGDDGIAVAMALAVLDDPSVPHPPLEVLLTTDEEIGMLGASALDGSRLSGRQLLNLDSEDEGVFTVSCAGGATAVCRVPVARLADGAPLWTEEERRQIESQQDPWGGEEDRRTERERSPEAGGWQGERLRVRLYGLTGGHSGAEIHLGRASANKLLGEMLDGLSAQMPLRLVSVRGGRKDNAIPVEAEAEIVVGNARNAMHALFEIVSPVREKFAATDPDLSVDVTEGGGADGQPTDSIVSGKNISLPPMDAPSTARVIRFLSDAPFGVQAWSRDIDGLVQTSLNLGILDTEADAVTGSFSVRSSVAAEKLSLLDRLCALTGSCGGSMTVEGDYPAWEYRKESPLRERCQAAFRSVYGREARVEAIHAGLECGILSGKLPGLDCVSLGPNLPDIHTPRERMEIASVQRTWALVLEILRVSAAGL